jgi:hypothetical protein
MSGIQRISDDDYIKNEITIQDNINEDKDTIINSLEGYIQIPYKFCDKLILGSKIKYITDEGLFRTGGTLIKIGFPNYIVLLNSYKKITWSVNLKTNNIFMEDVREIEKIKKEKENLYKLYKAGMLQVIETNEE